MGKRLVHLLLAVAMAVSAFAGLTIAPAGAVVEELGNRIYFPFVPNGDEYGNMGPWYGSITVQNPNGVPVNISIRRADGTQITVASLEPFASKTWTSAQLFGDDPGGGIVVVGPAATTSGQTATITVVRGQSEDGIDRIPNPCGTAQPVSANITQGNNTFTGPAAGADWNYGNTFPNNRIVIDWSATAQPDGAEPPVGSTYTITIACTQIAQVPAMDIAGVAKLVSPKDVAPAQTSGETESVTGYSALPHEDVDFSGTRQIVFPITQTNNGWNSVLHITNFDERGNCGVTVTFYESPTGYSDPSFGSFYKLLARGETWHIDLLGRGFPEGWVGQAWVSSDCDVAATVDRVKPAQPWGDPVLMALTNQALPVNRGNTVQALPLIFQAYNGWNTGYSIANLSADAPARVTVTYYNSAGNVVGTDQRIIQPRAMEFIYRPSQTDVGIGGFGSALVTSDQPVLVAVDSVKYTGVGQDVGQALGYVAQDGAVAGGFLYMPLYQKEGALAVGRDNSGIALFNTSGSAAARVQLELYDESGALVAPSLTAPVEAVLGPHAQFIFYAPDYAEMPSGLKGAVVVSVLWNGNVRNLLDPVVGVSNNVNYDVQYDGSAAYNMPRTPGAVPAVACTINSDWVADDGNPDGNVTGFIGAAFEDVPVLLEITDGTADLDFGGASNVWGGLTDADGLVEADVYVVAGGTGGTAGVTFWLDVNDNGYLEPLIDVPLAATTCTLPEQPQAQ